MNLITIAIPTYNRSVCLDNCLMSVSAQVFWDNLPVEIVVSDNASTDSTQDVVRKWQSRVSGIRYFRNDENIGGIKNFWEVTGYVQTEYFWFVADDVILSPGSLAHVVSLLQSHGPVAALIYGGYLKGKPFRQATKEEGFLLRPEDKKLFVSCLPIQNVGAISNMIFRTIAWRRSHYQLQPTYCIYPQIRSFLEVCSEGKIIATTYPLAIGMRLDPKHNYWYKAKAPLSVVLEFPWLQRYARELGFDVKVPNGFHQSFFCMKMKQWIRLLLFHPHYSQYYDQAIKTQESLVERILMRMLKWAILRLPKNVKDRVSMSGREIVALDRLDRSA